MHCMYYDIPNMQSIAQYIYKYIPFSGTTWYILVYTTIN